MGSYSRELTVRLRDTDAAGVLYFSSQLVFAHETFEQCLEERGYSVGRQLAEEDFMIPIVHAEADYRAGLTVGDRLTVTMTIERIGTKSFTVAYTLRRGDEVVGTCRTVHAALDRHTRRSIPLPEIVLAQLAGFDESS